jgi:hypothetical protein
MKRLILLLLVTSCSDGDGFNAKGWEITFIEPTSPKGFCRYEALQSRDLGFPHSIEFVDSCGCFEFNQIIKLK